MSNPKRKSLASSLAEQEAPENSVVITEGEKKPEKPVKNQRRPDRTEKTPITGWFPHRVKLELEEIKIRKSRELGRNVKLQEVLAEAFNDLFKKYGRAELAPTEGE